MALSIEPEISGCSVVMRGGFNPTIFHPSWLEAVEIESDISDTLTDIEVVHPNFTSFRIDTRIYRVTPDCFALQTSAAPWIAIVDITRQLFGELLVHTPIHALGINKTVHFNVSSTEVRNKIGRKLAPIAPWGEFGAGMDPDDPSLDGGLRKLTMLRKKRLDAAILDTNATVEPSDVLNGNAGIFVEINHHHDLSDYVQSDGANPAVELLVNSFETLIAEADSIIDAIMRLS